jgi:general secretion pathway protein B
MSYILDALKKSDQERQQGASPNLHATHGPLIGLRRESSSLFQQQAFWLISGGVVLFCIIFGIFYFRQHSFFSDQDSTKPTVKPIDAAILSPSPETPATPPQLQADQGTEKNKLTSSRPAIIENDKVVLSIAADKDTSEPSAGATPEAAQLSAPLLPFVEDLPDALRVKIPPLKFAGHTYAQKPSQRIIIINDKILREGDMIAAPNTFLKEITWEGVTIESNNILFRVKTN